MMWEIPYGGAKPHLSMTLFNLAIHIICNVFIFPLSSQQWIGRWFSQCSCFSNCLVTVNVCMLCTKERCTLNCADKDLLSELTPVIWQRASDIFLIDPLWPNSADNVKVKSQTASCQLDHCSSLVTDAEVGIKESHLNYSVNRALMA